MRRFSWVLVVALAACKPSATVQNTMPVANLQSFKTVALRVQATATNWQGLANGLQTSLYGRLVQQCGFTHVGRAGEPADVLVDLNVTGAGRGGTGIMRNPNLATIETLLVLSDGQSGDLLGTARIHGESSGMMMNGSSPEGEAVEVVSKTIAELLAKSGCSGPRVAKAEPPPTPLPDPNAGSGTTGTGSGSGTGSGTTAPDESHRAEAEALNDQGKDKLRSADLPGALAAFQQANSMIPDARYEFNVCLALEAQQQWEPAAAACKEARGMSPQPELVVKIDKRLDLIGHHQ